MRISNRRILWLIIVFMFPFITLPPTVTSADNQVYVLAQTGSNILIFDKLRFTLVNGPGIYMVDMKIQIVTMEDYVQSPSYQILGISNGDKGLTYDKYLHVSSMFNKYLVIRLKDGIPSGKYVKFRIIGIDRGQAKIYDINIGTVSDGRNYDMKKDSYNTI